MERVGSLKGIDGEHSIGQGPAISRRLRILVTTAALAMAGTLEAQELREKPHASRSTSNAAATADDDEQQLDRWMDDMDNDMFSIRDAAWHSFIERLKKEHDADDRGGDSLLARMCTTPQGERRAISTEQRERLRMAEEVFDAWKTSRPGALARGTPVRGDTALHLVRAKTKLPITASDDVLEALSAVDVDLSVHRDERVVNAILGRLCASTDTKPQPLPSGDIRLVPLEKGEKLAWSADLFGVLTTDAEGKERMSLHMEPGRGTMLAFMDHRGGFAPGLSDSYLGRPDAATPPPVDRPFALDIAKNGRPDWTQGSAQNTTYRTMAAMHPTHVHAVVADMPDAVQLTPVGGGKTVGPQSIGMRQPERLPDGTWSVTIDASVYGDVPWPPTPCAWDALTYSIAHANRYAVTGSDGKEMHATVTNTSFNMRCMTVRLACPREPTSITVHAFRRMDARLLELPRVRPPVLPSDPAAK